MAIRKKWKVMKVMLRPSHQASLLLANVATTYRGRGDSSGLGSASLQPASAASQTCKHKALLNPRPLSGTANRRIHTMVPTPGALHHARVFSASSTSSCWCSPWQGCRAVAATCTHLDVCVHVKDVQQHAQDVDDHGHQRGAQRALLGPQQPGYAAVAKHSVVRALAAAGLQQRGSR